MEILRTYDIWRMIDENKEEMVGKRYVQVGGLLQDDFDIGDIAVVTEYCGITSLGSEKHSKIRLSWNGFEKWKEVKEPVNFMEVLERVSNNLHTRITLHDEARERTYAVRSLSGILRDLDEEFDSREIAKILLEGKWYIE